MAKAFTKDEVYIIYFTRPSPQYGEAAQQALRNNVLDYDMLTVIAARQY
ncbi:hypothetical protein KCP74_07710 [Salmonella enterica subsp. enterica]|nr:hypothetical protein KCP74_07710 [Salmonella enterica subsp. enterica]